MSFLSLNEIRYGNRMEGRLTEERGGGGIKKEKTQIGNGGVEEAERYSRKTARYCISPFLQIEPGIE